jgi:isocitrate dehydrogenase
VLRPVRYFKGVPSPVKRPEKVDMVIFRENTEDIYAGIEWPAESPEAKKVIAFLQNEMGVKKIRFPATSGIGIKTGIARGFGTAAALGLRLRHQARAQERDHGPQGQHHEVHRGRLPRLGLCPGQARVRGPRGGLGRLRWQAAAGQILLKDSIADITLQQVLTRPDEFEVIATMNLNGDYLSDALAAQVGGIGIAPGGNINYLTGHAVFEATHGTAPKYANLDKVNPGSEILSGIMMLEHLGWTGAATRIVAAMEKTIAQKTVTYDFARLTEGATEVSCSEFATPNHREPVAEKSHREHHRIQNPSLFRPSLCSSVSSVSSSLGDLARRTGFAEADQIHGRGMVDT